MLENETDNKAESIKMIKLMKILKIHKWQVNLA